MLDSTKKYSRFPVKDFNEVNKKIFTSEMEVTEIILAKIYRFCQLSSHSRRLFAMIYCRLLNPQSLAYEFLSLAHKTPSYDKNMLPKIVYDKTDFVRFKISDNFKQNINKADSKQPKIHRKIHTSLWILKISRKKPLTKSLENFAKSL